MLNLFGTPEPTNTNARGRQNVSVGGATAATVPATKGGGERRDGLKPRDNHAFNAPEAEQVLGLRRLLVKVIGARDLAESNGTRRSCSAEVQLVDNRDAPFGSALHARTGPPNHFTTVKDTSPVWNAEFVTDLPGESGDLLTSGASLRFDVWDEAASPPTHLGVARLPTSELQRLCMREEERTLTLERSGVAGMSAMAAATSGTLRVRLSYIDVRAAMGLLSHAETMAAEAERARVSESADLSALRTQLKVLSIAMREEEERAVFFQSEKRRNGPFGSAAQAAAKDREEARLKKAQEDSATLLAALKEEKRQACEAVVAMHNASLAAFKDDLAAQAAEAAALKEEAIGSLQAEMAAEREAMAAEREETRRVAFENAEHVIEAVEQNCRTELQALQSQHAAALAAMQAQLAEQLGRERASMEHELGSRTRLVQAQIGELKAVHVQQLADMKSSMTQTIADYEQSTIEAQRSAREELKAALSEHESQLRQLRKQLAEAREGDSTAEAEAKRQQALAERTANEAAERHEKEVAYVKEAIKKRSQEQQVALKAMGARLEERGETLEKARVAEMAELQAELAQRELQHSAAHKEELTHLRAAYNDSIDRLKAELLALIEERAAAAEASKHEYEAQLLQTKRQHQQELSALRQNLMEAERDHLKQREAELLAKVSEYEGAVAELRESTLAAFADEQRKEDGALPALQERLEAAAYEHERAAASLLTAMQAKLAAQAELHSGEADKLRDRYERALREQRATPQPCMQALTTAPSLPHRYERALREQREESERALKQLDANAQARESELIERLDGQATRAQAERESEAARQATALAISIQRAKGEREAAVEQCNTHWMDVLQRQSAAATAAAEAAEAAHADRLAAEVAKVTALEEASLKQVEETSLRLRDLEEAVRNSSIEELNGASHRHERLLRQSIAKLTQEMSLQLEEERRRWQTQADMAARAAAAERAQAVALLEDQHRAAIDLAESQIGQLAEALTSERQAHQRSLDELAAELASKHAAELEEQHSWYREQLAGLEMVRDRAVQELSAHLEQSLAHLKEQHRETIALEQASVDRAVGRLQQEQAGALEAMALEASRELQAAKDVAERERLESSQRLAEDQQHRARVNQADLRRLEQHTSEMRQLLVQVREQWATREGQARKHHEEVCREVRELAFEQAKVEHERVLREAAAHGATLAAEHEAALSAALGQKDEQLGSRLAEYESQLAKLVTERVALQTSTREALGEAAKGCDEARAELARAQEAAEQAVVTALQALAEEASKELHGQHEMLLGAQRQIHQAALQAVQAQAQAEKQAMRSRLEEVRAEATARHRHSAAALGEAVKALHVRRENELATVAAEHAAALGWLRDEYGAQLRRQAKLSEEVLGAERARAEQRRTELSAEHEARVAELATETRTLAEERTRGWAHLPLPDLVRQALEEGLKEMHDVHQVEVGELLMRQQREVEQLELEKDEATAEGRAALTQAIAAAEQKARLALGEQRLQHEEERTRFVEELNKRTEAELAALRDDLEEAARRHVANEAKRVAAEESARVAAELQQLKREIQAMEVDKARADQLRKAMAQDADQALADEVNRLEAEVRVLRASGGYGNTGPAPAGPSPASKPPKAPPSKVQEGTPPPSIRAAPTAPKPTGGVRPQSRPKARP